MGGDKLKTLKAARQSPDWLEWEKAINSKLEQLMHMGTWQLMEKPANVLPTSGNIDITT
jgi:hypothetical protein